MHMHNPPQTGEFITEVYLEPNGISGRELAEKLGVAPSTLSRVLKGASRVSPESSFDVAGRGTRDRPIEIGLSF
ncbi:helix-turn-helix transcriptional regulator [Pseudomonas tehranensis]|uniref:helix-turn-helix transcriptional regulator n=1 Tax=Pseudomonas tehranensis TaxID=2745502 RepID=UPI0034619B4D